MYKHCYLIMLALLAACSSGGDDNSSEDNKPTNLVLSIDVIGVDSNNPDGDGSGVIKCTATATGAVKYGFKFEGVNEIEDEDGALEYSLSSQGTKSYSVTVTAYSSTNESVSAMQNVTVFVGNSSGKQLAWSDEFNTNGAPNSSKWNYNTGAGGWGNNELQTYTNSLENAVVDDGLLKITAKKSGSGYTSARIKSENLYEFTYGIVEVRAKLPSAQGTWPAIWMLGANFDQVSWPTCGEIDIMEQTGSDKNKVLGTCHWSSNGNYAGYGLETPITNATGSFHIYKLEWTQGGSIKISVDDSQYFEMTTNSSMPFNKDFFFILNIAMGGNLGGTVDPNFTEDTMEIDYVRVYQ